MFEHYKNQYQDVAPLVVFRILFGLLMFISVLRFYINGWIEKLYLEPTYHFKYNGFEWVFVPGNFTYVLFIIVAVSALFIAIGWKYRLATVIFFASFTYIELMDKTTYLNHYYFISLVSFLLIFIPAGKAISIDNLKFPNNAIRYIPSIYLDSLKLLVAVVYVYAGLAKINHDWINDAMPLALWLPSKFDIPLLGSLVNSRWVHYAFSWAGLFFDIFVVFFLLIKKTRVAAFCILVIFHLITAVLFPIGMFPYIMICAAFTYFSPSFHRKILEFFAKFIPGVSLQLQANNHYLIKGIRASAQKVVIVIFMLFHLLFPWRYLFYEGNVFWNEMGYRFSWRVMLMEKAGYSQFIVKDVASGQQFLVDNSEYLSTFQEKQMSTQVDFIIQYAHFLHQQFNKNETSEIEVYVDSYVALNGRASQEFVKRDINLLDYDLNSNYEHLLKPLKND